MQSTLSFQPITGCPICLLAGIPLPCQGQMKAESPLSMQLCEPHHENTFTRIIDRVNGAGDLAISALGRAFQVQYPYTLSWALNSALPESIEPVFTVYVGLETTTVQKLKEALQMAAGKSLTVQDLLKGPRWINQPKITARIILPDQL